MLDSVFSRKCFPLFMIRKFPSPKLDKATITYVRNKLDQDDDLADGFKASRWPSPLQPTAYAGIDSATLPILTTAGRSRLPLETRLAIRIGTSIGRSPINDLPRLFAISRRFPNGHLGKTSGIGPPGNSTSQSTTVPRKALVASPVRIMTGVGRRESTSRFDALANELEPLGQLVNERWFQNGFNLMTTC